MKTLISVVCFTVISWATAAAQDGVKVAPENYKVLLENAHVRMVDFTLKPGQKSRWCRVQIALSMRSRLPLAGSLDRTERQSL